MEPASEMRVPAWPLVYVDVRGAEGALGAPPRRRRRFLLVCGRSVPTSVSQTPLRLPILPPVCACVLRAPEQRVRLGLPILPPICAGASAAPVPRSKLGLPILPVVLLFAISLAMARWAGRRERRLPFLPFFSWWAQRGQQAAPLRSGVRAGVRDAVGARGAPLRRGLPILPVCACALQALASRMIERLPILPIFARASTERLLWLENRLPILPQPAISLVWAFWRLTQGRLPFLPEYGILPRSARRARRSWKGGLSPLPLPCATFLVLLTRWKIQRLPILPILVLWIGGWWMPQALRPVSGLHLSSRGSLPRCREASEGRYPSVRRRLPILLLSRLWQHGLI